MARRFRRPARDVHALASPLSGTITVCRRHREAASGLLAGVIREKHLKWELGKNTCGDNQKFLACD